MSDAHFPDLKEYCQALLRWVPCATAKVAEQEGSSALNPIDAVGVVHSEDSLGDAMPWIAVRLRADTLRRVSLQTQPDYNHFVLWNCAEYRIYGPLTDFLDLDDSDRAVLEDASEQIVKCDAATDVEGFDRPGRGFLAAAVHRACLDLNERQDEFDAPLSDRFAVFASNAYADQVEFDLLMSVPSGVLKSLGFRMEALSESADA